MNEESTFGKILIIDDEKDNTEIIKDVLEDVNYTTVLARSAIEAKAIVAVNSFDLISIFKVVLFFLASIEFLIKLINTREIASLSSCNFGKSPLKSRFILRSS